MQSRPRSSASLAIRRHSVRPPARLTSGWITSTLPRSIRSKASHREARSSEAAMRVVTASASRVSVEVVHAKGGLHKVEVAVFELANGPDRGLAVGPAVTNIDHEGHLIAEGLPGHANETNNVGIGVDVPVDELELDGAVAHPAYALHQLARASLGFRERGDGRVYTRIGDDSFAPGASHEFVHGTAQRLAGNVPEREIHGADRMDDKAASPRIHRALIHLVPKPFDVQRILADEQVLKAEAPIVRGRGFEHRLHHVG